MKVLCCGVLAGGSLFGAQIIHNSTITVQPTNWSGNFLLPQFDPTLGTLNSIVFDLTGTVEGIAQVENLSTLSGANITTNLSAVLTLLLPGGVQMVVNPAASVTDSYGAFDGVVDFDGTSGRTYTTLANSSMQMQTAPPFGVDLSAFLGMGNIMLAISSLGNSGVSGGSFVASTFQTLSGATLQITYNYTPSDTGGDIPEPMTLALVGGGLLGLGFLRSRRSAR
jgi:hypothetical protein